MSSGYLPREAGPVFSIGYRKVLRQAAGRYASGVSLWHGEPTDERLCGGIFQGADYPLDKIKELTGIVEGSVKAEAQLIALAAWMRRDMVLL